MCELVFSGSFGVQMCEFEFEWESNLNSSSNPSSKLVLLIAKANQ
jgi:hypothetical protein